MNKTRWSLMLPCLCLWLGFAPSIARAQSSDAAISRGLRGLQEITSPAKNASCEASEPRQSPKQAVDLVCGSAQEIRRLTRNDLALVRANGEKLRRSLIEIWESLDIPRERKAEVIARINKIPLKIDICTAPVVRYSPLNNQISGCIPPVSVDQATFLLAREFARSTDPCSYHASAYSSKTRYSKPNDYEKSLMEYPLGDLLACQPRTLREQKLSHVTTDKRWNALCAHRQSLEFFGDQLGVILANRLFSKRAEVVRKAALVSFPKLFCETKNDPMLPSFDMRYSLVLSHPSATRIPAKGYPYPQYEFSECFRYLK